MHEAALRQQIASVLDDEVVSLQPLSGGCVGRVHRATLSGGRDVVVKSAEDRAARLEREGFMLRYLRERSGLPVPGVLHDEATLLIMEHVESGPSPRERVEEAAADLLAALHSVRPSAEEGGARFGLHRDTLIGSLDQPNSWCDSWVAFFRERRLLQMTSVAARAGALPARTADRLERLADRLDELIDEPQHPALIHGDIWSGNVLTDPDHGIAAFIDPAVYYAHPEIELAFITLFSTFGTRFFERYADQAVLRGGFFETRRDVYNLYPLLVHVRLFGGSYVGQVESIVGRFGF